MMTLIVRNCALKCSTLSGALARGNPAGVRSIRGCANCQQSIGTPGVYMKMRIQLIIENESGVTTTAQIAALERRESDDLIGMSLEEAKTMTGSVQRALVGSQAREAINRASKCPECQVQLRRNDSHRMSYRAPFGRLDLGSPRFYRCRCQTKARQSFSPLANWLGDHTSPELQYLEAQFAA